MSLLRGFRYIGLVAVLASDVLAQSHPIPTPAMKLHCPQTPSVVGASSSYPGKERIVQSSRIALPAGKAVYARGELIYFSGVVYDRDCVPIANASVELWQTNTEGKYRYSDTGELLSPDPSFAGSGKAMTNNLGEYQFLTVFPGPYGRRAPHVHIRVTHEDFPTLFTEVFFEGDRRNDRDPKLQAMKGDLRHRLLAVVNDLPHYPGQPSLVAHYDIVLRGRNKFEQF